MQLFDDLEDFGSFDDAVSGDVRDPYAELAVRRREGAVQRLDLSGMPHDASKPVFMVYRHDEIAQMLGLAPGTIRAQLWRARRQLMRHLDA